MAWLQDRGAVLHPLPRQAPRESRQRTWRPDAQRAWHGCKIEGLYSILYHGKLRESRDKGRGDRMLSEHGMVARSRGCTPSSTTASSARVATKDVATGCSASMAWLQDRGAVLHPLPRQAPRESRQ